MSLSSEAQALFDHARHSLPRWLTGKAGAALEWLHAFTQVFDQVRLQGQDWLDVTLLDNASGAELDQHAKDRGTSRRAGETDSALRERLRQITDAVTEPVLIAGTDEILKSQGAKAIIEVANYVTTGWNTIFESIDPGGTGITFEAISDGTNPPTLVETADTVTVHFSAGVTTRAAVEALITASSTLIQVKTASAAGNMAAGDDFGPKYLVLSVLVNLRRDRGHCHTVGSCRAFMGRGYRMCNANRPMGYIVIVPYPTTTQTANAVKEYLRQFGPAGYVSYVERRANP